MSIDAAPPFADALQRHRDDKARASRLLSRVDDQPFEPWSAAALGKINPALLSKDQLPTYIKACDRVKSAFDAKRDRATLLMAGPNDRGKNLRELETPAHELCAALRIPLGAAHGDIYRSRRLALLPRTRRLYERGLITRKHVAKITSGTGHLTPEQCEQVEHMALCDAELLSVHEFARRVRRAVALVAPRTTKERHDAAAESSDVSFEAGEDGMSFLISTMPLLDGLLCKKAYDHYALKMKKEGDPRPLGVLRAEAQRVIAEAYLTGRLTGTIPNHHGRPVEVQVAVTPEALLGLSDTPAEIPGVGPIPIETIRQMVADAKVRWITISGDNGRLLDRNPKSWRIPPSVHAFADTAYPTSVGPHSTVLAERCDGEHLIRHPDGPTTEDNIVPMDRGWHVPKTHTQGMFVTRNSDASITWTTPLGQTVTVQPYDYRLGP
jgi:hypothetical protein